MYGYGCKGKTAIVLGGTRGIGRAAAAALLEAGAAVTVTGREEADAKRVAEELDPTGVHTAGLACDITESSAAERVVNLTMERFGRIDVFVANAGINPYFTRAENVTRDIWDEVMAVNLRGLFFAVQAVGKTMLAKTRGSIICMSSVTAQRGTNRGLPYVASKGGVDAMVRTLAVEWAHSGIRVNAVSPGYIATDLTAGLRKNEELQASIKRRIPMAEFGMPTDLDGLIVYLASDASRYLTGQVITIDGGLAIA